MFSELKKMRNVKKIPLEGQAKRLRKVIFGLAALSSGIGFFVSGRPHFGLLGILIAPYLHSLWCSYQSRVRARRFDEEMLHLLTSIEGLVRAGLALPSALKIVTEKETHQVAVHVQRYLARFQSGKSFEGILHQFNERSGVKHSSLLLPLLAMAQMEGVPISDLLSQMTRGLRLTLESNRRILSLRRSVLCQGLFATLIPWMLLIFLCWLQPGILNRFFSSGTALPLVFLGLAIQFTGGFVLWNVCRFR